MLAKGRLYRHVAVQAFRASNLGRCAAAPRASVCSVLHDDMYSKLCVLEASSTRPRTVSIITYSTYLLYLLYLEVRTVGEESSFKKAHQVHFCVECLGARRKKFQRTLACSLGLLVTYVGMACDAHAGNT